MKKNHMLGILAITMVAILGMNIASAHGFMGFLNFANEDKETLDEEREALQTAIENSDYETWEELMQEKIARLEEAINEDNFNEIVERHQEMKTEQEERKAFCEENECPNFENKEFRGRHNMPSQF